MFDHNLLLTTREWGENMAGKNIGICTYHQTVELGITAHSNYQWNDLLSRGDFTFIHLFIHFRVVVVLLVVKGFSDISSFFFFFEG